MGREKGVLASVYSVTGMGEDTASLLTNVNVGTLLVPYQPVLRPTLVPSNFSFLLILKSGTF